MAVDTIQERLTSYAQELNYERLSAEAIHAVKVRVIDTLGALIGGFSGEPSRIARSLAGRMPVPNGATVIGTTFKTMPDMAAFVNSTTSRFVEANDVYHWPGSYGGHPSDVLTPVLAASEYADRSGSEFIVGVALAYEVYLRISDAVTNKAFDATNFCCLGTAVAAGKLLGLSSSQLAHCISMAAVPNNILAQVRTDHLSMFKATASGQAARAGMFAALLAQEGMEGPYLPFEGKAGWCNHIAKKSFSLDVWGGDGTPFRVTNTMVKPRSACAGTIPAILAAEKIGQLKDINEVKQVTVEIYKRAKDGQGTGDHHWNPGSRETADHSLPYATAATLMEGTVTPRSFDDAHLWNPEMRAFMQKIEVVENAEFTQAFSRLPVEHRSRVTVVTHSGERLVGEAGGDQDDLSARKDDAYVEKKFRGLTEGVLGTKRVDAILDRLWHLEELKKVSEIPPAFVVQG